MELESPISQQQQQFQEMTSDSPRTGVSHTESPSKSNYEKVFFLSFYLSRTIQKYYRICDGSSKKYVLLEDPMQLRQYFWKVCVSFIYVARTFPKYCHMRQFL